MSACRECQQEPAVPVRGSVRAIYCSTTCRARYHKRRRSSSERRQQQYVLARLAEARTPADRAQVLWDALRAVIGRLPRQEQPDAWEQVGQQLQMMSTKIKREESA